MRKPLFAFCALLVLFLAALCGFERLCFKRNHSFSLHLIHSTLPEMSEWAMNAYSPEREAEIRKILQQTFSYLGKGKQAFVFESEDKKTVLKIYRFPSEFRPFATLSHPFARSEKKRHGLQEIEITFQSLKCSFDSLREETGFLWLHLHKGPSIAKEVVIIDKLGVRHRIPLEETTVVLQKKGTLLYPTLEVLLSQGKIEEAKRAISHLIALFYNQAKKGVENTDAVLDKNYGLLPDGALIIDSGKLQFDDALRSRTQALAHAKKMTHTLKNWLEKHSATLLDYYEKIFSEDGSSS